MNDPMKTQIGGQHYTKMKIQPFEFSMANGLDPIQHTIIKYVTRYQDKKGVEDLEKAKHCVDLLIKFKYPEHITGQEQQKLPEIFNGIDVEPRHISEAIKDYVQVYLREGSINELIEVIRKACDSEGTHSLTRMDIRKTDHVRT